MNDSEGVADTRTLPRRCFISHSYKDAEARERLLAALPSHVEPVVFPPIRVSPLDMVSNELIRAILDCDGVIYLEGGFSAQSFWVAFERDYGRRAGKPVFAFHPATAELKPDASAPLQLPVFAAYQHLDRPQVDWVLRFMRRERHFDLFAPWDLESPGAALDWEVWKGVLQAKVAEGGYVVAFVSEHSIRSEFIREELALAKDRAVLAALDAAGLAHYSARHPQLRMLDLKCGPWPGVLDQNALDDLIVWLYWMIQRDARPGILGLDA